MDTTAKLSCFVMFILIGSTIFSLTFRGVDGDLWVEHPDSDLAKPLAGLARSFGNALRPALRKAGLMT